MVLTGLSYLAAADPTALAAQAQAECPQGFEQADAMSTAARAGERELGPQQVPVRIGLHAGEVIVEPGRLTGLAVNIAARIESFAVPGGVMLSDSVDEQIANRSDIAVVELGRFKLQNVGRPFGLYVSRRSGRA